jgi:hypothetical protein
VPGHQGRLVAERIRSFTHLPPGKHGPCIVERQDVESSAQDQREFGLRAMPVRPDIGIPVCRDEEPLHRVRRGLMQVQVGALAGRRGGPRREVIEDGL